MKQSGEKLIAGLFHGSTDRGKIQGRALCCCYRILYDDGCRAFFSESEGLNLFRNGSLSNCFDNITHSESLRSIER